MTNVTLNLAQALDRALSAYKGGKLIEAEQLCQQIIAAKHDCFDAFDLLANVQLRLGKKEAALTSNDHAITLWPNHAVAHGNRGHALEELKRFDEALASYDRAIELRSDLAWVHFRRGTVLQVLRRHIEAVASYDRAIGLRPAFAMALCNRGVALDALKRFDEALASYDRAIASRPGYAKALYNRGNVLQELKRFEEALASYDRALSLRPDLAEAHTNRGSTLQALKRFEEAVASYDRALSLRPDYADAHSNRGVVLQLLQQLDESLASHDQAIALRPNNAAALYNRGITLHELERFEEALASYDRALAVRPDWAEAHHNRGNTLKALRQLEEALASYDRAIALKPDYADPYFNRSECLLSLGNFDRGWREYEWRWEKQSLKAAKRRFAKPRWLGDHDLSGRTILLHAEQGFGDTIQFCRYATLVAQQAASVVLEVPTELKSLLRSLKGPAELISYGEPIPEFDYHCPLMSLPLAFNTRLDTVPAESSYLTASPERSASWRDRLGTGTKPRIGLVWAGNPRLGVRRWTDRQRSLDFDQLAPLFATTDYHLYSLQKGDEAVAQLRRSPWCLRVVDYTDDLRDFADTAALIANLDLVISVDTSVAHLVGALGKPLWLLNRFDSCWRWLLDREDSPWYPTVRIFRQQSRGDWTPVIERIAAELRMLRGE